MLALMGLRTMALQGEEGVQRDPPPLSSGSGGGRDTPVSTRLPEPGFLNSPALPPGQIHLLSALAQPHRSKLGKRRRSPWVWNTAWHSQEISSNRFYSVAWRPLGQSLVISAKEANCTQDEFRGFSKGNTDSNSPRTHSRPS